MPTLPQFMSRCLSAVPYAWRAKVKRVPLVGAVQRWATSAALDGRPFVHLSDAGPARGMRFLVQLPEDKGIWTGTYEADFAAAVAAAVRPGAVCYDIGGWHGYFAAIMAARRAGAVHVFEPLPGNADRIARTDGAADGPVHVRAAAARAASPADARARANSASIQPWTAASITMCTRSVGP